MEALPSVEGKMWAAAIDPETDALKMGVFKELSNEDASSLDKFAAANDLAIDVYVDETASRPVLELSSGG